MNLYVTADRVGIQTGGGLVTRHESQALAELGPCEVWGREFLEQLDVEHERLEEPWKWDLLASGRIDEREPPDNYHGLLKLAHFYAGTFEHSVGQLKDLGARVTYTAAAHDVAKSRVEHEKLGIQFNYPHLTDPVLWERYVRGYLQAGVLICPSKHSADVMRGFGARNRIEVIPHGVDLPKCKKCLGLGTWYPYSDCGPDPEVETCPACKGSEVEPIKPLPARFTVGNLGAIGPDKGVRYLLEAWRKLDWKDATLLLGGSQWSTPFGLWMIETFGGQKPIATDKGLIWNGTIATTGWVNDVSDFYDACSVYCQPSVTEGFGCEIPEAMVHGRPVICSKGAGAADLVPMEYTYEPMDVDRLCSLLEVFRNHIEVAFNRPIWRQTAESVTWDKVRERYKEVWKELLK